MKKKNIYITFSILGVFCAAAMGVNFAIDYNYMFLRRADGTPYQMFYDLVNGNPVLYPMIVILLFLIYITAFYLVYFLIGKLRARRAANAETEESAEEKEAAKV